MTCQEIRHRFVEYYQNLGFEYLPPAPMMHESIPMSFVMSAGLVQVETSLANQKDRKGDKYVLVQNCFRHFDMDKVGTDGIHLSMFEMPGAFMFSKNGKRETIERMWTLATKVLEIDPERIWVTYLAGGEREGIHFQKDEETYQTWLDLGIPSTKLIGLGPNDNLWMQGGGIENNATDLRKCGPNTELFYDRGAELACGENCRPSCKCGRFVEFSNTLFISHQFRPDENVVFPLDDPFVETVIGTERVAMLQQEKDSVFETINYQKIIQIIDQNSNPNGTDPALVIGSKSVISDHFRALYTIVKDGAPWPGKNGRQRIVKLLIREILTRSILINFQLNDAMPEINRLIDNLFTVDISDSKNCTTNKLLGYFEHQKDRFDKTSTKATKRLQQLINQRHGNGISGRDILALEKKWGLSPLLSEQILLKNNMEFPREEYLQELTSWKENN